MTSEVASNLEFELLDFGNLCSHVSLASNCHYSLNLDRRRRRPNMTHWLRVFDRSKNRTRSLKQHIKYFNFRGKIQSEHPEQQRQRQGQRPRRGQRSAEAQLLQPRDKQPRRDEDDEQWVRGEQVQEGPETPERVRRGFGRRGFVTHSSGLTKFRLTLMH